MIKFVDLERQHQPIKSELFDALSRVLERGSFVLGEEVRRFEEEFAGYCGSAHAVGVASGTDALLLSLKALGVGPGDEVIAPAFTAPPTVVAVVLSGARPVLADIIQESYSLDPEQVERLISPRTRVIVPVHLFGLPAPVEDLMEVAGRRGVHLVEDACQAHGARWRGKALGTWGEAGCFSFYPTKNLSALGDGGMVITDDPELADRLRRARDYGRKGRDLFETVGHNSRLDELQAAFLRVKLRGLEAGNRRRRQLARLYLEGLRDLPLRLPVVSADSVPAFHLFVVSARRRDELSSFLAARGIQTLVHYPYPVHLQPAFAPLGYVAGDFPRAERAAQEVLSLPLYPEMEEGEVEEVISAVKDFFCQGS
jgi:dTDP-4-amino-4,6-dideoxygalactose transaminase